MVLVAHANVLVIPQFVLDPPKLAEVGVLPERRWTNPKGVTNQTKNVPKLEFGALLDIIWIHWLIG